MMKHIPKMRYHQTWNDSPILLEKYVNNDLPGGPILYALPPNLFEKMIKQLPITIKSEQISSVNILKNIYLLKP